MTIAQNNIITYNDLLTESIKKITSICSNIGNDYKDNVPDLLKNGTSDVVLKQFPISSASQGEGYKSQCNGWVITEHTSTIKATVEDPALNLVPIPTVKTQLEEFLSSRGVKIQSDETITFKNMMAFYNNLASFLSSKLIYVTSLYTKSVCVFYNPNNVTYPAVTVQNSVPVYIVQDSKPYTIEWLSLTQNSNIPLTPFVGTKYIVKTPGNYYNHPYYWTGEGYITDDEYTNSQVQTSLSDLLSSINSTNNVHYALTKLVYACCSSSSSSCSSSSSSSSSSSMFIAYMDI